MARIALRYDTAMSRAMLRALGMPAFEPTPKRRRAARAGAYRGVGWCFANHGSPMDGRP